MVWIARGTDRVYDDLNIAVGPILEADWHRKTGRKLAMYLTFGRTGANCTPRDQVGNELRGNRIEELRTSR